ncbi:MAG: drug/metabolite transporter (DMT)-like permease, partial [Planctomycetota bacterium]
PAYKLSLVAYVTPAVALGLGAWLNDEPVTGATGLGALGILAGVALVVAGKRRRPADG